MTWQSLLWLFLRPSALDLSPCRPCVLRPSDSDPSDSDGLAWPRGSGGAEPSLRDPESRRDERRGSGGASLARARRLPYPLRQVTGTS